MVGVRCCSRPHGNDGLFAPLLAAIAFCLSCSSSNWCDFMLRKVSGTSDNWEVTTGIGLWSYSGVGANEGYCVWYDSSFQSDSYFQTSQALAAMANTLGGIATIILLFSSCLPLSRVVWTTCGLSLLLSSLFQGLVFLLFKSSICNQTFDGSDRTVSCALLRGSRCCIAAVVFWFVSSLSVLRYNPPTAQGYASSSPAVKQTVTTTEEVKEDGTRVTTTKTEYTNV